MMITNRAAGLLILAGLTGLAASPAGAQRFSPWLGLYAPTGDIGSVQAYDLGKTKSTSAWGLDIGFGQPDRAIGVRVGGAYAGDSDVPVGGLGCTACTGRATVLTATGALIIRPLPLPVVRPYAVVGGGAKWYNFDFDDPVLDGLVSDQAKWTALVGVGAALPPAGSLNVFAEIADHISGFDLSGGGGNTQHGLFLKVGISFGLGGRR